MSARRRTFSTLLICLALWPASAAGLQFVKLVMTSLAYCGRFLRSVAREETMAETRSAELDVKRVVMHSSRSLFDSSSRAAIFRKGWFGRQRERLGSGFLASYGAASRRSAGRKSRIKTAKRTRGSAVCAVLCVCTIRWIALTAPTFPPTLPLRQSCSTAILREMTRFH